LARGVQVTACGPLFRPVQDRQYFVAISTTILSLAALVFFTINAINAAGIPLSWSAPLPGITLSLVQIFLLIGLLMLVFWISSHTKRFLFTRFLANSGSTAPCNTPSHRLSPTSVLIVGIFIVLETPHSSRRAHCFSPAPSASGVGLVCKISPAISFRRLVILAERPITIGDRVEVAGVAARSNKFGRASTVIRTNDNITMIVPNTNHRSPVTNWTYGDPRVRFRIPVGVAYGSDVNKVARGLDRRWQRK